MDAAKRRHIRHLARQLAVEFLRANESLDWAELHGIALNDMPVFEAELARLAGQIEKTIQE